MNTHDTLRVILAALLLAVGMSEADAYDVQSTGQTDCWNTNGVEISCKGSGHDGEYQAGIGYKKFDRFMGFERPTERFREQSGNRVLDKLTGLRWLRSGMADPYPYTWFQAMAYANTKENRQQGWRMPNVRELISLIEYTEVLPDESGVVYDCMIQDPRRLLGCSPDDWPAVWSSTTCPNWSNHAYAVDFEYGTVFCADKAVDNGIHTLVKSKKRWMMK